MALGMIIIQYSEKFLSGFHGCWARKIGDGLDFARYGLDPSGADLVAQKIDLGDTEDAFIWTNDETVIFQ